MFDDGPKAVNQHTIYSWASETFQKSTLVTQATSFKNSTLLRHIPGAPETQLPSKSDTRRSFRA